MTKTTEIGVLILRVSLGFIFFAHGLMKFQGGVGNTAGFFDSIGVPGFLAYPIAIIEAAGGILLILGLGNLATFGQLKHALRYLFRDQSN